MMQRTLLDVWNTTLSLWDSVIRKRIKLQQLNLELTLKSVLNGQVMPLLHKSGNILSIFPFWCIDSK